MLKLHLPSSASFLIKRDIEFRLFARELDLIHVFALGRLPRMQPRVASQRVAVTSLSPEDLRALGGQRSKGQIKRQHQRPQVASFSQSAFYIFP